MILITILDNIKLLREHQRHLEWLDYKYQNQHNEPLLFAIQVQIDNLFKQIENIEDFQMNVIN